jgi:hypothetical protein
MSRTSYLQKTTGVQSPVALAAQEPRGIGISDIRGHYQATDSEDMTMDNSVCVMVNYKV